VEGRVLAGVARVCAPAEPSLVSPAAARWCYVVAIVAGFTRRTRGSFGARLSRALGHEHQEDVGRNLDVGVGLHECIELFLLLRSHDFDVVILLRETTEHVYESRGGDGGLAVVAISALWMIIESLVELLLDVCRELGLRDTVKGCFRLPDESNAPQYPSRKGR
jgi:hypothetical protein